MIQVQFINQLLKDKNMSLATLNNITEEYFTDYKKEFVFIQEHYNKYSIVPDKETFLNKFPDFTILDIKESKKYLIDAIQEDYIYRKAYNVFKEVNEKMVEKGDSRSAIELLLAKIPDLTAKLNVEAIDILHEGAQKRFEEYCDKGENVDKYYIKSGLPELDEIIGGWSKANDLVAVCGRPGTGKSWWMDLFLYNAAKEGHTVALYSGEMGESQVGYRIDTFASNISNYKISKGFSDVFDDYQTHIIEMQKLNGKFLVCTPNTLGGVATVPKLKAFCERYKVDILGVDQYSLMEDARNSKIRNEKYESISKDLKTLQIELGIPVLVNAQLNRGAVSEGVTEPGTEHLAGSDRISQDSSIVLAITKRKNNLITLNLIKVREAATGGKLSYKWDIDKGTFEYVDEEEMERLSNEQNEATHTRSIRNSYNSSSGEDTSF